MKLSLFAVLLLAGSIVSADSAPIPEMKAWRGRKTVAQLKKYEPQVGENQIVFGPKKLILEPNGVILCTDSDGRKLFELSRGFWGKNRATGKIHWTWSRAFFDKKQSVFRRDGSKFVWEVKFTSPGDQTFTGIKQSLEILPDGRLRYSNRLIRPELKDWILIPDGIMMSLPQAAWNGAAVKIQDRDHKLDIEANQKFSIPWQVKQQKVVLAPNDAVQQIKFEATRNKNYDGVTLVGFKVLKNFRLTMRTTGFAEACIFDLDLSQAGEQQQSKAEVRSGIDFLSLENLEMPDYGHKNLVVNPSFERKFIGWNAIMGTGGISTDDRYDTVPFAIDAKEKVFGNHSLRIHTMKRVGYHNLTTWEENIAGIDQYLMQYSGINLRLLSLVLEHGKYTFSFYAKSAPDAKSPIVHVWVPDFLQGRDWGVRAVDRGTFKVTPQWKRYSMTVDVTRTQPVSLGLNATAEVPADIWIDGVQLEKGTALTAFVPPPAEGRLETSDEDNFVSDKAPLNARMVVTAAPGAKGKMRLLVRNFFHETVLDKTSAFTAGADGTAAIPLPELENAGRGIFMVRAEYTLSDGRKCFDQRRFVRAAFLENKHPRANLYTLNYGSFTTHSPFTTRLLPMLKKCGYGGAFGHLHPPLSDKMFDLLEANGYRDHEAFMGVNLKKILGPYRTAQVHKGILPLKKARRSADPFNLLYASYSRPAIDDPEILAADHNLMKCELDDKFFAKFTDAVADVARENPRITLWSWGGEIRTKFPNTWWHKSGREEDASRVHAMYLKAFADGIRKGNPKARVFQDTPCNMTPDGGIAETERLLKNTNKLGVKFDVIGIHPYRFSPEDPDLDADTALFIKMLDRVGYGKAPIIWPEMMHWGPYNFPQWGTVSSSWLAAPRTWRINFISYDMGWTEKIAAAWMVRSWLVALKYDGRISQVCSGGNNNTFLDNNLTPSARLLAPNALGHLLGDAKFRKDIRFAPFTRTYVFEDAQRRPVAAVWCHMAAVDEGKVNPPIAEADFGDTLEGVYDMMYAPRAFNKNGKTRFAVTSFPLFFRGKPGTLNTMLQAFSRAAVVSGEGIAPVSASIAPATLDKCSVKLTNFVSVEQKGTLNNVPVAVPASGTVKVEFPFASPLRFDRVKPYHMPMIFKTARSKFDFDFRFEAAAVKQLSDVVRMENIDWSKLPSIPFIRNSGKKETSGSWKLGWNSFGLFLEVKVHDAKFVHRAYEKTGSRWNNDCLQIYIDTMADARGKKKGYDDNDYDFAMFPNPDGKSAVMWRYYSPDNQLTLGTAAPKNNAVAHEIPCWFSNKDGVLTYRVFFPARYILPINLRKGTAFGFGLYAANVDQPGGKVTSALTTSSEGKACYNRPDTWPIVLLAE